MPRVRLANGPGGGRPKCGKPALAGLIFLAALAVFVLQEDMSARRGTALAAAGGASWADRLEDLSHWAGAAENLGRPKGGMGGAGSLGARIQGGSGGGKLDARLLRELHHVAQQTPDPAAFAGWAVANGLLAGDQLTQFLDSTGDVSSGEVLRLRGGSDDVDSIFDGLPPETKKITPVKLPPLRPDLAPLACPLPTVKAARKVARDNTVVFALMNAEFLDFGMNWYKHLQKIGVSNVWVAVYEETTAAHLVKEGIPCFDARQMLEVDPEKGFTWGETNWNALVWGKVSISNWIMQAGFNLVLTDTDVIWFKDPIAILQQYTQADLLVSTDALQTFLQPGDQGFEDPERIFSMGTSFNTGVMLWRNTPATRRLAAAWERLRAHPYSRDGQKHYFSDQDALNEHYLRPGVNVSDPAWFDRGGDRIIWTFGRTVPLGCFPMSRFATGHGYSVQRLHKVMKLEPYVLHTTYVYGQQPGKRTRLREGGLWLADPPSYFQGPFLALDIDLPEVPAAHLTYLENGTMPWELEQQINFHVAAVQFQLEQLYFGFALAVALNRTLILPEMRCFCDKNWYMTDEQCHTPGAHELRYPYPCPADYLFWPGRAADEPAVWGPPIDFRVYSFLDHPSLPATVKQSTKVVRTSNDVNCHDCSKERDGEVRIPRGLDENSVREALRPYADVSILRFADAGNAFGRFSRPELQRRFEKRLAHFAGSWCCRSPAAMERDGSEAEIFYSIRPLNSSTVDRLRVASIGVVPKKTEPFRANLGPGPADDGGGLVGRRDETEARFGDDGGGSGEEGSPGRIGNGGDGSSGGQRQKGGAQS